MKKNRIRFIKSRKAATFDIYNWFVLIVSIFLLTAAVVSLYTQFGVSFDKMGARAKGVLSAQADKEIQLIHVEEAAKRAAYAAVVELASNGGNVETHESSMYYGAPIILESKNDIPDNKYPKESIYNNFHEIFYGNFFNELESNDLKKVYTKQGLSVNNGNTLYGFAYAKDFIMTGVNGTRFIDVYASLGYVFVYYSPSFIFKFQDYDLDDYSEVFNFVKEELYDDITECEDISCAEDVIKTKNDELRENNQFSLVPEDYYEIMLGDKCFDKYQAGDYFEEYYSDASDEILTRSNQADDIKDGKFFLCIFDKTRLIQGKDRGGDLIVDYPAYNVALSVKREGAGAGNIFLLR